MAVKRPLERRSSRKSAARVRSGSGRTGQMQAIPGAMTPSEIKRAWKLGADIVKLFPADDLGYHYIQNLMGPLGHIPLMATGGVNPASIPEFFRRGIKAVGTGTAGDSFIFIKEVTDLFAHRV